MPILSTNPAETTPQKQVQQVASTRSVHEALNWVHLQQSAIEQWQMELVAVPAPPFHENKRAEWLKNKFEELGLEDVQLDEIGNVLGLSRGSHGAGLIPDERGRSVVAVTAHIDTVFPEGTNVKPRREGARIFAPGISDNGSGVSALLALAGALQHANLEHAADILFVGNVGEEGEGDLRGIRHLFTKSPWKDRIGYTLVLDGTGTDTYVTQALGSVRLEITLRGPGGHSWSDFGVPNPIVVLSRAIAEFSKVELPEEPKTTYNFGVISGGTSVNSIPETATVRVDIRSGAHEQIVRLEALLRDKLQHEISAANASRPPLEESEAKKRPELALSIKRIGERPAAELPKDARIAQVLRAVDAHLGVQATTRLASTDANIPISLGREALSIGSGGIGAGAHTLHEWYEPRDRELGLKRILLAVAALAGS